MAPTGSVLILLSEAPIVVLVAIIYSTRKFRRIAEHVPLSPVLCGNRGAKQPRAREAAVRQQKKAPLEPRTITAE